jgi:hypothetical protein
MAWDASRPVPWRRLVREWAIYAGIMAVVFALLLRDAGIVGVVAGLVLSLPLYLLLGYVLAKFGYERARLRAPRAEPTTREAAPAARPKPPPTKRTGGGAGRPGSTRRRR